MAEVMGHPDVLPQLLQLPYASAEQWATRLAEMLAPGRHDLLLMAELQAPDGQWSVVGNAGLSPCGPPVRRRHAMNLGIALLPRAQGQGIGRALMQALCDYADDWAQVLRIELGVYADNARAIALYQRFGFEIEGRQRGYALRGGQYVDTLMMARLHPHPPRIGGWSEPAPGAPPDA